MGWECRSSARPFRELGRDPEEEFARGIQVRSEKSCHFGVINQTGALFFLNLVMSFCGVSYHKKLC